MDITDFIREDKPRWCYYVPSLYRLHRCWRVQSRKIIKRQAIHF